MATYTASGSLKRVDGVDMEEDNVTLRLMDAKLKTPKILDLTGFGADSKDKIVFDAANYKDYFNWQTSLPSPLSADKTEKNASGAAGINGVYLYGVTQGIVQRGGFAAQDGLRRIYGGYSYATDPGLVAGATNFGAGSTDLARGIVAGYSTEFLLPEIPDFYISLGRNGAWIDTNENGVLDGSESLASVTSAGGGYYTVDGVNMGTDKVFLRVVDEISATPLDLTGFGSGDKLIIDGKTTQADMYGMDQFFMEQAKSSTAISFSAGSSASVMFSVYSPVYRQAFIGFTSLTVPVYTANSKQLPSLPYGVYGYGYSSGRKQSSFYNPLATGLTRGGIQVEIIPPQPLS